MFFLKKHKDLQKIDLKFLIDKGWIIEVNIMIR